METKGKVHFISEVMVISEKFRKRELVLEITEGAYPEFVKFEATQDKVSILDDCKVGDMVEISFNLRGRAWNNQRTGKTDYFNTLNVWRVKADTGASASAESHYKAPSTPASVEGEDDDLPF